MSTALTLTTPTALATFADSPQLRDAGNNPAVAVQAFAELSAACRMHLDARATGDEYFQEILYVLIEAFPTFRISEIMPAMRDYSLGKTGVDPEDMKTYGQALKPLQVLPIIAARMEANFQKARALQALSAPPAPTPEQEARESELRYAAGVLQKWDYLKERGRVLDGGWQDLSAYDAWIVVKNRPDWFTPEAKAVAKAAAASLNYEEVARLHEMAAPTRLLQNAGFDRAVKTTAVWEHEQELCGGWQNAACLKLLLWGLIPPPPPAERVSPEVIAAVMQEGGAQ